MNPQIGHNPDILTCLANLSADEVFTPPKLANAMLDLLPSRALPRSQDDVSRPGVQERRLPTRGRPTAQRGAEKSKSRTIRPGSTTS